MKILFDLLPVLVFFGVFSLANRSPQLTQAWVAPLIGTAPAASDLGPVVLATVCCTVATVFQVGWLLLRRARVPVSLWLSAALMIVLGGLTVWLKNEWFIKWKPTVLYWAFAAVLAAGQWIWRRNLLGALFSNELELPPEVWDRVSIAWTVFFVLLGIANIVVAYHFSTQVWAAFKLFGAFGLTLAFSIGTAFYVVRYVKTPET